MSQFPSVLGATSNNQSSGELDTLNDLDLGVFLKLMIVELQNQDPLDPIKNDQLLAQINQIREVGATDKLTATLESVLLGQNISSATNLIGKEVEAISDTNEKVSGQVVRVSITGGQPQLELDLKSEATRSQEEGDVEPGKYSYRIVWQTPFGTQGIELSGDDAVSTLDAQHPYPSIKLSNLPITDGPKQIYRTDRTNQGDYLLVTTLVDGSKSSYLDTTGDGQLSQTRQTEPFAEDSKYRIRNFKIDLKNVSSIRPTG